MALRPGRRTQDAIEEIRYLAARSYEWVLEADITGCDGGSPTGASLGWSRPSSRPASSPRMVAGARAHAEALTGEVAAVLATMGLRLSEAKTSIRHIDEGVCFLGWRIQRHQQRGSQRRYVYTYPSKKALAAVKATVRTLTTTIRNQPLGVLLRRLNWVLRAGPPTSATGPRRRPSTTCAP
jgi:hypothetical protein